MMAYVVSDVSERDLAGRKGCGLRSVEVRLQSSGTKGQASPWFSCYKRGGESKMERQWKKMKQVEMKKKQSKESVHTLAGWTFLPSLLLVAAARGRGSTLCWLRE